MHIKSSCTPRNGGMEIYILHGRPSARPWKICRDATRRRAYRRAHTTIASVAHRGGYRETRRQICGKLSERGDIGTRSLSRRWENEWDARTRNVHAHTVYIYIYKVLLLCPLYQFFTIYVFLFASLQKYYIFATYSDKYKSARGKLYFRRMT